MKQAKRLVATVFATALLAIGAAAPASAHPPLFAGGLVNIIIVDAVSLDEVNVQVPIGVAANVCGFQANVLAQENRNEARDCTASTTQDLPVAFRP